jgi:hypothetical protein
MSNGDDDGGNDGGERMSFRREEREDGDGKREWRMRKRAYAQRRILVIVAIVIVIIIVVGIAIWWWFSGRVGSSLPAPTNLSASVSSLTVTLNWSAVTGASSYVLYISKSAGVTESIFGTKVRFTTNSGSVNLAAGTYFFAVAAARDREGDFGLSGLSNEVTATTPECPASTLVPPTALNAEDIGDGQIELEWPGVLDAASYVVYRAQGRPVSTTDFDQSFQSTSTELLFTNLASGTQQSFIVTTVDDCGAQTNPSPMVTVTVDCAAPDAPEITSALPALNTIKVTWSPSSGATSYVAYLKAGSSVGKNNFDVRQVVASSLSAFTFTALSGATNYAIGISAANDCGEGNLDVIAVLTTGPGPAPSAAATATARPASVAVVPSTAAKGARDAPTGSQQSQKPAQQAVRQGGRPARGGGSDPRAAGLAHRAILPPAPRAA